MEFSAHFCVLSCINLWYCVLAVAPFTAQSARNSPASAGSAWHAHARTSSTLIDKSSAIITHLVCSMFEFPSSNNHLILLSACASGSAASLRQGKCRNLNAEPRDAYCINCIYCAYMIMDYNPFRAALAMPFQLFFILLALLIRLRMCHVRVCVCCVNSCMAQPSSYD